MAVDGRKYWRCDACAATFLDPYMRPSAEEERATYLHHQNHVNDAGYRAFLSNLVTPLLMQISAGARGLDYGSGPGPALAAMLREAGHPMNLYDPFFAPNRSALDQRYDFITCTETAEHFFAPADELDRLGAMVHPGGLIAIMTTFQTDDVRFATWSYRRDPTHVVFYRQETFHTLAELRGWRCEIPARNVALLWVP